MKSRFGHFGVLLLLLATSVGVRATPLPDGPQKPITCTPVAIGSQGTAADREALTFRCRETGENLNSPLYAVLSNNSNNGFSLGPDNGPPSRADIAIAQQLLRLAARSNRALTMAYTRGVEGNYAFSYSCSGAAMCVQSLSLIESQQGAPPPVASGPPPTTPPAGLPLESAPCQLTQIEQVNGGVKLHCSTAKRGIDEFVLAGPDASLASALAAQAKRGNRAVNILFAFEDKQPVVAGCNWQQCRNAHGVSLRVDPTALVADRFTAELLSYIPPRIRPYDDIGRGDYGTDTPGSVAAQYIGIRDRITQSGRTLQQCALNAKHAKNILGNEAYDRMSVFERVAESAAGVSNMINAAKAGLIGALASLVPGCDEKCKAVMSAGLDIALVAAGLPPSIPNVQQIIASGAEGLAVQLVKVAAAQVAGVPLDSPLADAALSTMTDYAKAQAVKAMTQQLTSIAGRTVCPQGFDANGGCKMDVADPFTWAALEPAAQPFPAMAYVRIRPKGSNGLKLRNTVLYVTVDGQPYRSVVPNFALDFVPDEGVVIAVALQPMIDGVAINSYSTVAGQPDSPRLSQWASRYLGDNVEFWSRTLWSSVPTDRIPVPSYVSPDSRSSRPKNRDMQLRFFVAADLNDPSAAPPRIRLKGKPIGLLQPGVLAEVGKATVAMGQMRGQHGSPERAVCGF